MVISRFTDRHPNVWLHATRSIRIACPAISPSPAHNTRAADILTCTEEIHLSGQLRDPFWPKVGLCTVELLNHEGQIQKFAPAELCVSTLDTAELQVLALCALCGRTCGVKHLVYDLCFTGSALR